MQEFTSDVDRIVLVGDFNLDLRSRENVDKINPLKSEFYFNQRSNYKTHIQGGILDLVFDNKLSDDVKWVPSPYSDHFVLCVQI